MQYEMFDEKKASDEEPKWVVVRFESHLRNGRDFVTYTHTRPVGWIEPAPSTKLPWEA